MSATISRAQAEALDAIDPLASLRAQFELPEATIYLDGNSLGALPKATAGRVAEVVRGEWGRGLVASWNDAGWIDLPARLGDKIARLVGAGPGEVIATDSTSVNLYKVLSAAWGVARSGTPERRSIVAERGNFPTDLYIAESFVREHGADLRLVERPAEVAASLDEHTAVLMLTHVDYRSGRRHDMAALTAAAHAAGALVVWDLAHSAGAVPVDLTAADADFAIGCGYKYLNGGPGAPAFVWAHPRLADRAMQPLSGWMGHASPFDFTPGYRPAAGISRFLCGTPPVLAMAALECGIDTVLTAEALGGVGALLSKALALADVFAARVESRCDGQGLALVTPREHGLRGSQISFALEEGAYAIVRALIARGVVGDFRAPDILRFGFAPLYTRYVDAWDAAEHLAAVLESGEWRDERFARRSAVT